MKMVITGISREDAKAMVEALYGSCMWGIEKQGITCYPTGEITVVMTHELPKTPPSREDK